MTAFSVTGLVDPISGLLDSFYVNIPPTSNAEYLFDQAYLPTQTNFEMTAYWPDVSSKDEVQNWNTAHPSLPWEQPFYAYGANAPVLYEIVEAPSGMTIGSQVVRDVITGFFKIDDNYGVLKWHNPIQGTHRIAIRATDQDGRMASWVFRLKVDPSLNYFMALAATGDGSGSSPSNFASWTDTIIGQTTVSPSKGKVLRIKGDQYPVNSNLRLDKNYVAASWVAMPTETPVFLQKFTIGSDDIHLQKLKYQSVGTSSFGVVNIEGIKSRIGVFGCEFDECFIVGSGGGNQSCIGANLSPLSFGRERIFISSCNFKNSETLHGFDFYSIKDYVFFNNNLTITNGATSMPLSWIFPKVQANGGEIMFNSADVPTITSTEVAIIQIHNGWEPSNTNVFNMKTRVEYNLVRSGGANIMRVGSDTDEAISANFIDTYIKRNTFIGEYVGATNYSVGTMTTRRNFWESNIAINDRNSGSGGIVVDVGDTITGNNIFAGLSDINSLLDANFAPLDTLKYGKTGRDIWKPE
jgi:hypothetical protein